MDVGPDDVGSDFLLYVLRQSRRVGKVGIRLRGVEAHGAAAVEEGEVALLGNFSTVAHHERGLQCSPDTVRNVTAEAHHSRPGYHQED